MAYYLLDTSVLIDTLNAKHGRSELLRTLLQEGNTLACCCVTVAEVYAGMRPHEATATDELLRSLFYLEITWQMARSAGRLKYQAARTGHTMSLADAMIASVALEGGLTLISDNEKHFQINGLKLFPLS
jgi:predicted nucleic acid-binding protein